MPEKVYIKAFGKMWLVSPMKALHNFRSTDAELSNVMTEAVVTATGEDPNSFEMESSLGPTGVGQNSSSLRSMRNRNFTGSASRWKSLLPMEVLP